MNAAILVLGRILSREAGRDPVELALRLWQRRAGFEASEYSHSHADAAVPEQRLAPLTDGNDDRGAPPDHVIARDHADDRVEPLVQHEAAA